MIIFAKQAIPGNSYLSVPNRIPITVEKVEKSYVIISYLHRHYGLSKVQLPLTHLLKQEAR